tara:strand:- start:3855 stop:4259 length:405 start_codon:yes stop_codon:yes gene_type:complete
MADAVTSQTIQDGARHVIMSFTNVSDGTGESAVKKVDVSALGSDPVTGTACSGVAIQSIWFSTMGMSVKLLWDADADVLAFHLPADYADSLDMSEFTGLKNNAGTGVTGDIMLTTVGHSSGDAYTVILKMTKNY